MEQHLRITGSLLILLAFIHASFPRYFEWKKELGALSIINRQLMYVHSFFIALVILLMGILCLTSSAELTGTILGKRVALIMSGANIARPLLARILSEDLSPRWPERRQGAAGAGSI